jgi:hypothetical protein
MPAPSMMFWQRGERAVDWNNLFTLAGVLIGTATAAYVGYSKKWPAKPDPVLTGIGFELSNREQTERLIGEVRGCRVALEVLADRRTEEMEDMHKALLERLDAQERREEQEEQSPRRHPPRRR